jgi:hypothetical protein
LFTAKPEVEQLVRILLTIEKSASISYISLSAAIGLDVRTAARSSLQTARRRLIAEYGRKFECVELSLVRLDDVGVIRVGEKNLQFIRRKGRRTFHDTTQCVENYETLNNTDKQRFDVTVAVAGVLTAALRPKVLSRIAPLVTHESANQRAIVETMDTLRKLID